MRNSKHVLWFLLSLILIPKAAEAHCDASPDLLMPITEFEALHASRIEALLRFGERHNLCFGIEYVDTKLLTELTDLHVPRTTIQGAIRTWRTWENLGTDGTFSATLEEMARLARITVVNVPHHVTQRGNARQFVLASEAERKVYWDLLRHYVSLYDLSLLGYCLMSSHVHLVVVPRKRDALATALKQTHGRYASYWNAAHRSSGHVWQGRFYSCPLDDAHLWIALRYAELNPVRAGLVARAELWEWSSAAAHCGAKETEACLELGKWSKRWSAAAWREYLASGESEAEIAAIRQCTHTGRPLGGAEFVHSLEEMTLRGLTPRRGGRPSTASVDGAQRGLIFERES